MDDTRACTECGTPVAFGERHHSCGVVAMKYQQRIAELAKERDVLLADKERMEFAEREIEDITRWKVPVTYNGLARHAVELDLVSQPRRIIGGATLREAIDKAMKGE